MGSSKHSSGSTSRASCATGDARDIWVFEPRVDLENLTAHSRVSAEAVFAKVEKTMMLEINEAVDTALATFLSTIPNSMSDDG